jgi:hypothetical protein
MKKIVCAFVVLMLAAPASAAVNITAVEEVVPEPNVLISYECTAGEVVRCFALDIQLDNHQTITAVECLSDDYYLNPQKFTYDGVTPDFGVIPCLCAADDGILPGLDSNCITIAMCSLYAGNDPDHNVPPQSSGDLIRVILSGSACITITENGRLGGVLNEDNNPPGTLTLPDPNCVECCVCPECLGDVSDTTGFGPPDNIVDIGDLNYTLMAMFAIYTTGDPNYVFPISPIPPNLDCMNVSDTTGFGFPDDQVDIGDLNYVLMAMFAVHTTGDPNYVFPIPCLL